MKHDTWRHDPAQYSTLVDIATRYSDVDTLRHLNNSALHGLHAEARMRFLSARIGDGFWRARGPRLLVQRVLTDFLLESQYPQPLQAAVRVTALDERQLSLGGALFQGGHCVGLQSVQLGCFVRGQPQPLPSAWWQALDGPMPPATNDLRVATPVLPRLAQFERRRHLDTRYGDLDATGRVGELAWMRGAEQGRSVLLRAVFSELGSEAEPAWQSTLVARVDLHLLQHAAPPPRWQIGAAVTHLGRSSVVLRVAFFGPDEVCSAYADSVLVFVDRAAGVPVPMDESLRLLLDKHRLLARSQP